MKISKIGLTVPSIGTVRARKLAVAVSIQGTHIVYHRGKAAQSEQREGNVTAPQQDQDLGDAYDPYAEQYCCSKCPTQEIYKPPGIHYPPERDMDRLRWLGDEYRT
jgi:hypothetical protein